MAKEGAAAPGEERVGAIAVVEGSKRRREEDELAIEVAKVARKEDSEAKVFVKEIPASTIILASNSDYFKTMFTGQFRERSGKKQADIYLEPDGNKQTQEGFALRSKTISIVPFSVTPISNNGSLLLPEDGCQAAESR